MNYSQKLMSHMRAYASDWDKAEKTRNSEMEKIKHWIKESKQYTEQYNKIMKQFHEAVAPSYKEHLNACVDVMREAYSELKKIACGDVPESFNTDIALITAGQDRMTELEYLLYLEKYATSYPCIRSILNIAKTNKKCEGLYLRFIDTFKRYVDECVSIISNFFNGYGQPTGDINAKMAIRTDDEGNENNRICKIFNDELNPFYSGDYYTGNIVASKKQTEMLPVLEEGSIYTPSGDITRAFTTGNKI